jgi:hypothetical protein
MPEPLFIGVQVDVSPLETLGNATKAMAERFIQSGLSAKEAASALQNLGVSAKEAAEATGTFGAAAAAAGEQTARATTSIDSMTRAMAAADVRVVSSISGLGGLGNAFARVGAASSTLAPILAAAFPVIAAVALVDIIGDIVDKFSEWARKEDQVKIAWNGLALGMLGDTDRANQELQHLNEKFVGLTQGGIAELQRQLADVAISFESVGSASAHAFGEIDKGLKLADVSKWNPMAWLNPLRDAKIGTGDLQPLADKIEVALQDALRSRDPEKIFKALDDGLRQMAAKQKEVTDTINKSAAGDISIPYYQEKLRAIAAITDALQKLQVMQVDADATVDQKRSNTNAELVTKQTDLQNRFYEDGVRFTQEGAKADLERIEQRSRLEREAQAELDRAQKENAEEQKRDAREAEEAWQRAVEVRIKGEEEDTRRAQTNFENQMRNAKAQESLSTAGIGRGPITTVIESSSLQQQGAIAASAMAEARGAADSYSAQLDLVRDAMGEVNTKTEEGAREFRALETQMSQLQRLFDTATAAGDHWEAQLKQIEAQQKALAVSFNWHSVGTSMQAAANQGFDAFNSGFTKMLAGGMSFTRVMQSLWTSMVDSFITSILKMAEYYIEKKVIMIAMDKLFHVSQSESAAAGIAATKAQAVADIGLAGAGGVASMAAAPFPIDLTAPAFGAAMAASAASFAAFEKGGIVTANLHEGEMVLPKNISTFVQTAAASAGGMGGAGGVGGRGGDGGAAGHTFNFSPVIHGTADASMMRQSQQQFTKMVTRELRRRGL